jgi:6-phosphogluconolactonase
MSEPSRRARQSGAADENSENFCPFRNIIAHEKMATFSSDIILVGSFAVGVRQWKLRKDGKFEYIGTIEDSGPSPSWLSLSNDGNYMYETNETGDERAAVAAFRIERSGTSSDPIVSLQLINRVKSEGADPCHCQTDESGSALIVSNYNGGTLTVCRIEKTTGRLLPASQVFSHSTSDTVAHVHQSVHVPGTSTLLVCDLGMDAVYQYSIDDIDDDFRLVEASRLPVFGGPRHLAIHPNGKYCYVLNELKNTLVALPLKTAAPMKGHINLTSAEGGEKLVYYNTLRESDSGVGMQAAEVLVSEDGRFVYVSNRDCCHERSSCSADQSGIAVFEVLSEGEPVYFGAVLRPLQHVCGNGRHPRHMTFLRGGRILAVAFKSAEWAENVPCFVTFAVDQTTGLIDERSAVITTSKNIVEPTFLLKV